MKIFKDYKEKRYRRLIRTFNTATAAHYTAEDSSNVSAFATRPAFGGMASKSIMQKDKECWRCRIIGGRDIRLSSDGLHLHHVIHGTANRRLSDKYGLVVWLCPKHHEAIHRNAFLDRQLKEEAQSVFEQLHSRSKWMEIFGKSYL